MLSYPSLPSSQEDEILHTVRERKSQWRVELRRKKLSQVFQKRRLKVAKLSKMREDQVKMDQML